MARSKPQRRRKAKHGTVPLLQSVRHRVPSDAPEEVKQIADRALARALDVLEERVDPALATSVLKAATLLREEICGPVPRDINLKGSLSLETLVREAAQPVEEIDPSA